MEQKTQLTKFKIFDLYETEGIEIKDAREFLKEHQDIAKKIKNAIWEKIKPSAPKEKNPK